MGGLEVSQVGALPPLLLHVAPEGPCREQGHLDGLLFQVALDIHIVRIDLQELPMDDLADSIGRALFLELQVEAQVGFVMIVFLAGGPVRVAQPRVGDGLPDDSFIQGGQAGQIDGLSHLALYGDLRQPDPGFLVRQGDHSNNIVEAITQQGKAVEMCHN
jgi:hypothetical protein